MRKNFYSVLCIPVEGETMILPPSDYFNYLEKNSLTGIIIGHSVDPDVIYDIFEVVNSIRQNQYVIYNIYGDTLHEGFLQPNGLEDGEHLSSPQNQNRISVYE